MDYITIVAPTYEEAVTKAKKEYGNRLRIHSRKNIVKSGLLGFGKTTLCELTCFLTEDETVNEVTEPVAEKIIPAVSVEDSRKEEELRRFENEARTPNPDEETKNDFSSNVASFKIFEQAKRNIEKELNKTEENQPVEKETVKEENNEVNRLLDKVKSILVTNDFTDTYINHVSDSINEILKQASPELPSDDELELLVLDRIAEDLQVDSTFAQNPDRIVVVLGPVGAGKTTMVAKLTALFSSVNNAIRRNVRVVLLDDSPAVVCQLQKVGKALNIPVTVAPHEAELSDAVKAHLNNELVFVDAIGKSVINSNPDYKIYGLMNVTNRVETKYLLVLPATMKNSDIARAFEQYKSCYVSGLMVTKLDETSTVGNILSASCEHKLPILYTSSGKKIPKDISKASSNSLLRLLKGFSIDINKVLDSEQ